MRVHTITFFCNSISYIFREGGNPSPSTIPQTMQPDLILEWSNLLNKNYIQECVNR